MPRDERDEREAAGPASSSRICHSHLPYLTFPSHRSTRHDRYYFVLSTSTGVSSHAHVHVGVIAPEYNQAGKRVQRHGAQPCLRCACTGPSQGGGAQIRTLARAHRCTQGTGVCTRWCLPARMCTTRCVHTSRVTGTGIRLYKSEGT